MNKAEKLLDSYQKLVIRASLRYESHPKIYNALKHGINKLHAQILAQMEEKEETQFVKQKDPDLIDLFPWQCFKCETAFDSLLYQYCHICGRKIKVPKFGG